MQLGRLPTRSDPRALMLARFAEPPATLPARTNFWPRRAPFPLRSFGNLQWGDCTRAKQAVAAMRMERLETNRTPSIADEEVVRVYRAMTERLYGGGDTGAYETDALDCWRRPEYTFRKTNGQLLTIDAYVRIDAGDQHALRAAMVTAGAHGIAVCLNLPLAFQSLRPPADWDVPATPLLGPWLPGSWGGHSMWATDYDEIGLWLEHTWELPRQRLTWKAAAAYLDEAHLVIDSIDAWRQRLTKRQLDLAGIRRAVNQVSSQKVA